MQKRGRALRIQLEIDGEQRPGLNKIGGLKPENAEVEIAENGRKYFVKDGVITWPTIEGSYLDTDGSGNRSFFRDWLINNELKDVTYIVQDGHGTEVERILLPDCECMKADIPDYDAAGPGANMIDFKIGYYEPVFL